MRDPTLVKLKAAVKGLLYPSEYDSPFDVISLDGNDRSGAAVAKQLACKSSAKSQTLDEFFEPLAGVEGFAGLRLTLEELLHDIRIYRFGSSGDVVVALVGSTSDGHLVGLKTISVET